MDDLERMIELRKKGFYCSQIMLIMGLELQGKYNPDLVRCMHGLAHGLGYSGEICGALTSGACLLGLYAGKGKDEDFEDPHLDFMVEDLVKWFKAEFTPRFGGINCDIILSGDPRAQINRCPILVAETFQKVKELLVSNGFDLSGVEI